MGDAPQLPTARVKTEGVSNDVLPPWLHGVGKPFPVSTCRNPGLNERKSGDTLAKGHNIRTLIIKLKISSF